MDKVINKKRIWIICLILVLVITFIINGLLIGRIQELKKSPIVLYDTIIDVKELKIIEKEIEQYNEKNEEYKYNYEKEKEYIQTITDSAAIELFFKLASE